MERYINEHEILRGAARALFVTNWADNEAAHDRTYSGQELTEVAPPTSVDALLLAAQFLGRIEQLNGFHASVLYSWAKDRNERQGEGVEGRDTPHEFGFMLAMESLGHGVAWSDNNAKTDIKLPYLETNWMELAPTRGILGKLGVA